MVVFSGDGGGGWYSPRCIVAMPVIAVVVIDGGGLKVVGWGCGSLFPTRATGIVYFLNNLRIVYAQLVQLVSASLYTDRKVPGLTLAMGNSFFLNK